MSDGEAPAAAAGGMRKDRGRVREFVANRPGTQRVGVVAAVLVLLTAPFGGLRSEADEPPAKLELGQRIDIGPFYVTLDNVKQLTELPPVVEKDPTSRILSIRITVTNHTDRPEFASLSYGAVAGDHTGAIPWPDDAEVEPHVFDIDDASDVPPSEYINPHLSYTYALLLRQQPGTDLDALTLSVYGYTFLEDDPQTLDPDRWVLDDDAPLAEGHVTVEVVP